MKKNGRELTDQSYLANADENLVREEAYRHHTNVIILERSNKERLIDRIRRKINAWRNHW